MELLSRELPINHKLILSSDWHLGSLMFNEGAARDIIARVKKEKNTYIALGGDLIEAIAVDDKRFQHSTTTDPIPLVQANKVIEMLKPIAHKILFVLEGNHEFAVSRIGDLAAHMARTLGVPYGTYSCKCSIQNEGKQMYKLYYTHGFGSINSKLADPIAREAAMKLAVKKKLMELACDVEVFAMGHTHKLLISTPMRQLGLVDDGVKIKQQYTEMGTGSYIHPDLRFYCNTGSLMKLFALGVSGYAERAGYSPVETGYCQIEVKDGKIQTVTKQIL